MNQKQKHYWGEK